MTDKIKKLRTQDRLKNTALILLILLLPALMLMNFFSSLSPDGLSSDSPITRLYNKLTGQEVAFVQRGGEVPAAYPSSIAMARERALVGARYNDAAINAVYDKTKVLLAQALQQADKFVPTDEKTFTAALQGYDTLLYHYDGNLPVQLIASWLGTELTEESDITAGTIVLCDNGALYVRSGFDDALYTAMTKTNRVQWMEAYQQLSVSACSYAGLQQEDSYAYILPETVLTGEDSIGEYAILTSRMLQFGDAAGSDSLQIMLEAFSYNPYVNSYDEDDGQTFIYVENYSTLRISQDGTVSFTATATNGGIEAYQENETNSRAMQTALQVECARTILATALRSINSGALPSLQSVYYDENTEGTVLIFSQTIGGISVENGSEAPFARFEFQRGMLVAAELHLCDLQETGEMLHVVPEKQAAASLSKEDEQAGLYIAYLNKDGRWLPTACFRKMQSGT